MLLVRPAAASGNGALPRMRHDGRPCAWRRNSAGQDKIAKADARFRLGHGSSIAAEFATSAPLAVRAVKRALARSANASLEDQLSFEAEQQAACFETEDVREGLTAAKERRPPKFQGR